MKKVLNARFAYLWCIVLLLLFSCTSKPTEKAEKGGTTYTCPMHPQIIADKPGACPICHMDLVPVSPHVSHDGADATLENLVKPANQLVVSQIRTVRPAEGVRAADVQLQGVINYDTNNWNAVSSRVAGRIERLYVKYNYQYVSKGQKLMDIYSPDLANAQQELLYLKSSGDKSLLEASKNKLRVLGATNEQINTVLRTGKVNYRFSVYSLYSGYVAEQKVAAVSGAGAEVSGTVITSERGGNSMDGMEGQPTSNPTGIPPVETNAPLQLREGQYVNQGQKLFELVNASSVFADFFAGTEHLVYFKKGREIQVSALDNPGQKSFSKISLIQPYYSEGNTFSLLRAKIDNGNKKWKIGQLITIKTDTESKFGVWLPRTAVLQLGTKYIAFVQKGKAFVPVYVTVAQKRGDWIDVGSSLGKTAEVAVNAWFMVDSESFVKVDSLRR